MARKKPMQYVPLDERTEFIEAMAALPIDPAELEAAALKAAHVYHDAMLAGDVQTLDDADLVYQACVCKLNGGTRFGCSDIQRALEVRFAAPAGHVPRWGQAGEFLLEVDGMRLVVVMKPDTLSNHCGAELNAVDFDKPFVSKTGYLHHYMRPVHHLGLTVDQAVRAEVVELLTSEGKAVRITDEEEGGKNRTVRPWLADALAGVRPDGQLAMFGDAPKDPDAKVAKSNAERQRALRKRRKEQQLKPVMLTEVERQWLERLREQGGGEPVQGGSGDFATLEVTDAPLLSVWENLPTDFARAATALGLLRLRNNQHAELARAVQTLKGHLMDAGLEDQAQGAKRYWNTTPLGDYRSTSSPEYMERMAAAPTLADELREAQRYLANAQAEIKRLQGELSQSFENNYRLRKRLKAAGLPDDLHQLPGE